MKKLKRLTVLILMLIAACIGIGAVSIMYENPDRPYDSYKLLSHFSSGTTEADPERKIKIRVEDRGDAVWEWFGHAAIIVEEADGTLTEYNYGLFDFAQDNFVLNFIMGQSFYSVGAGNGAYTVIAAENQQRTLHEYELDLDDETAAKIAAILAWNVQRGNNTYLYRIFTDNCSTRLRDIIDKATDGQFREWAESIEGTTFREEAARATAPSAVCNWLLNLLTSGNIDKPITLWDEMFLPERLAQAVEQFSYTDKDGNERPLVKSHTVPVDFRGREVRKSTLAEYSPELTVPSAVGVILALLTLFLLIGMKRSDSRILRLALGIPSAILCLASGVLSAVMIFISLFTIHDFGWNNENLFYINPLLFFAMFRFIAVSFGKREKEEDRLKGIRRIYIILTVLMLVQLALKFALPAVFMQFVWGSWIPYLLCYLAFIIGVSLPAPSNDEPCPSVNTSEAG